MHVSAAQHTHTAMIGWHSANGQSIVDGGHGTLRSIGPRQRNCSVRPLRSFRPGGVGARSADLAPRPPTRLVTPRDSDFEPGVAPGSQLLSLRALRRDVLLYFGPAADASA